MLQAQVETLQENHPRLDPARLSQLVSCSHSLLSPESESLALPDFPADSLESAAKLMELFPSLPTFEAFNRLYPYTSFLPKEGIQSVEDVLKTFEMLPPDPVQMAIFEIIPKGGSVMATVHCHGQTTKVEALRGGLPEPIRDTPGFVDTPYQASLLAELLQSHCAKDLCLIGPRGSGKSMTVQRLADLLAYEIEPIVLYQDMTSRDLIQQRTTLPNGDTVWQNSPLVSAALEGKLAILDGIHRIHASTLAVIHRLVHDRELQLYDGRRMLRSDRYDEIKSKHSLSDQDLANIGVLRIHPAFRIIALSEPPVVGGSQGQWLTPELLTLFLYHQMRPLSLQEELHIIKSLYGRVDSPMQRVVQITHKLRNSEDPTIKSLAGSLSTRQLLRIARRMAAFPEDNVYDTIQRACLARFLPTMARQALDSALLSSDVTPIPPVDPKGLTCQVDDKTVKIGNTTSQRFVTTAKSKVPDVLFYDVPQHLAVLEWLLQDFQLGEHLLLVGNQGVGKNKLADRLLFLLNRPREYIQLHRDTTVQTLTLQPTVRDGVVVYEDSPLVQAVKWGHVLVVDEADKAPTHTLVESGEMILSDGRRIVPHTDPRAVKNLPGIIPMHPDFRMIVLANRPGFPFLGNDFFGALGDLFSCHAVDNPSQESEIALLKNYGPDVSEDIIYKLVKAFGELRTMADQGLVSYPYSTREVVNIVRHMQQYPNEGLASVVRNVFDFDSYSQEVKETLVKTLHKHGIPLGTQPLSISLGKELPLPKYKMSGKWQIQHGSSNDLFKPQHLPIEERYLKLKGALNLPNRVHMLDKIEARSASFSEQQSYWSLPLVEPNVVASVAVERGPENDATKDKIHVLVVNPASLYSMKASGDQIHEIGLQPVLDSPRGIYPSFTVAPLGGKMKGCLLIHDEMMNQLVVVSPDSKEASQLALTSTLSGAAERISQTFFSKTKSNWRLKTDFLLNNYGVLYELGGNKVEVINIEDMTAVSLTLPCELENISLVSKDKWLIEDTRRNKYVLQMGAAGDACPSVLLKIDEHGQGLAPIHAAATQDLGKFVLNKALGEQLNSPNRLFSTRDAHAALVVGFPELDHSDNEVYQWNRIEDYSSPPSAARRTAGNHQKNTIILPNCGQIVQPVAKWKVPKDGLPDNKHLGIPAYIEVTDLLFNKLRYIPVPEPRIITPYSSWLLDTIDVPVKLAETSEEGLVSVDAGGCVRLWETGVVNLERSLKEWRRVLGDEPSNIQITIEQPSGKDVSSPKYGKIDETGAPHVGGNTWAGGTGGRDTAGLGGKGGPFRLDGGHEVYQVSQEEKDAVPEHVKRAAREMAQKAFKERLREIRMTEYDAGLYGLTGEKTIYRRRAERDPELGAPQQKPKRLKLVVDVSGSMYRFNSYDGRLDRVMEAAILMMEAFEGHEKKFQYDIMGHSGESYDLKFVDKTTPPANNKERLDIIKTMHAHAQFCMSGDHTLEATKHAITSLAKEDCDESFVLVLSDANLERYGIPPQRFGQILTSDSQVNAYAIFIGSLGNQADRLTKSLPTGRAFVCLDLTDIPQIMQQIFAASVLSGK
ncbi:hypothetical protein B566_EDAN009123 [Ephemera danica]|nr:hypothetical protein B566_EDAN009123 [Ephemera danica]